MRSKDPIIQPGSCGLNSGFDYHPCLKTRCDRNFWERFSSREGGDLIFKIPPGSSVGAWERQGAQVEMATTIQVRDGDGSDQWPQEWGEGVRFWTHFKGCC